MHGPRGSVVYQRPPPTRKQLCLDRLEPQKNHVSPTLGKQRFRRIRKGQKTPEIWAKTMEKPSANFLGVGGENRYGPPLIFN